MPKTVADAVLDAALNHIRTTCTRFTVLSGPASTIAEVDSLKLAEVTGITSGDFVAPADGTSGRKLVMNQKTTSVATATGTATHVALSNAATAWLYTTTCTNQNITTGNTVTIPSWTIQINDPT